MSCLPYSNCQLGSLGIQIKTHILFCTDWPVCSVSHLHGCVTLVVVMCDILEQSFGLTLGIRQWPQRHVAAVKFHHLQETYEGEAGQSHVEVALLAPPRTAARSRAHLGVHHAGEIMAHTPHCILGCLLACSPFCRTIGFSNGGFCDALWFT